MINLGLFSLYYLISPGNKITVMKPTLCILAAGMASRYGSMKQVQSFGPSGETIMDYSIYDAIQSGFKKIVFIIRKDFATAFKDAFEPKWGRQVETAYVYQEMDSYLEGFQVPADRTKPWGTAHAVLCAKPVISDPFAVINADDFYGRDAFEKAYLFLTTVCNATTYSIIGYDLSKTLSENGSVSRGVCEVDTNNNLVSIHERTKIYRNPEGKITYEESGKTFTVPDDSKVSMNFWCFSPAVFSFIEKIFQEFLRANGSDLKSEFFIPIIGDRFIHEGKGQIKIIPTDSSWFGVTYKEDAPSVQESITKLVASGEYPGKLY
jgi:UTP-glucose-1-phosphate uridylyltransferase